MVCRTQALVLSPTRELATQTDKTVRALGEFLKLKSHCCIGGKSIGRLPRGPIAIDVRAAGEELAPLLRLASSVLSVHVAAFAGDDIRVLESGAQIVSGTPGRVFDMIKRRSLDTRDMKILVLDEADEMLNKGFREQIYDVYRYLPPEIQVILVSATLPHDVLEMTHKFMQDPVRVLVKRDELTLEVHKLIAHSDPGIVP